MHIYAIKVVAFKRTDDEVDDAKVENFFVRIFERELLLLLLDLPHQLLRLLVLRRHDVRHAQVGQHDGRDV